MTSLKPQTTSSDGFHDSDLFAAGLAALGHWVDSTPAASIKIVRVQTVGWETETDPPRQKVESEPLTEWGIPCEATFERLAAHRPRLLIRLIRQRTLDPGDMTFAAEIAGRALKQSREVVPLLFELLSDRSPLVREGAVMGLSHHLEQEGVEQRLRQRLEEEEIWGVREAIVEVLDRV